MHLSSELLSLGREAKNGHQSSKDTMNLSFMETSQYRFLLAGRERLYTTPEFAVRLRQVGSKPHFFSFDLQMQRST